MKKQILIFKIILFIVMIAFMVILTMAIFRSSYPNYWLASLLLSVTTLIFFPYKRFFNINKNKF
mgnify:CR=1 FL=1